MNSNKATLIGLTAVFLWSLIVALIKEVSHYFGPIGGAALIYSCASIILLFSFGWTHLKEFPLKYLIWGSLLFVAYEICLALSIGYSSNNRQAIEIGMVNYVWPTAMILFSIIFNRQKANFLIFPGICLSVAGICLVLGGEAGFSFKTMLSNIQANPLSYGLALTGVFLWAAYCTLTARAANGKNGITLFFIWVSIVLWTQWIFSAEPIPNFELNSSIYLVLAAFAMGIGYGAWNIGIMHGNVTVLATASYFIPVFSSVVSALILSTQLTFSFWKGALMVCFGSLLCWMATKAKS